MATDSARSILAVRLVALSLSELPYAWFPQHLLAKRMITIMAYFRSQVVKFVFCGRISGQKAREQGEIPNSDI